MKPHEERVVKERDELKDKLDRLCSFIDDDNSVYLNLPKQDKILLNDQAHFMEEYLDVLNQRIKRFPQ